MITLGWIVALVALLIALAVPGALPADQRWWLWTCGTGVVMGLFGLWYVPILQRDRARAATQHAGQARDQAPVQATPPPGPDAQSCESDSDSLDSGSNTVSSTDTPGRSTRS